MNHIYIGDRQLEPDDELECETCDGTKWILVKEGMGFEDVPCPSCQYDEDPGEPNEDPE